LLCARRQPMGFDIGNIKRVPKKHKNKYCAPTFMRAGDFVSVFNGLCIYVCSGVKKCGGTDPIGDWKQNSRSCKSRRCEFPSDFCALIKVRLLQLYCQIQFILFFCGQRQKYNVVVSLIIYAVARISRGKGHLLFQI
jgi:hypothetical protein